MTELIAATMQPSFAKRDLLLFDRIACPTAQTVVRNFPDRAVNLRVLMERGIVFSPKMERELPADAALEWQESMLLYSGLLSGAMERLDDPAAPEMDESEGRALVDAAARVLAVQLRWHNRRSNVVPITFGYDPSFDGPVKRAEVVHLVVGSLPVPSEGHTIDDVLAFKKQIHDDGVIQDLRNWIIDMSIGKLSGPDVEFKLAYLLGRLQDSLKCQGMKWENTVLDTLIVPASGVIDYLTKVGSKLFSARRRQIEMIEAERRLPGSEVAYIVKARERFRPT